jgi:hypothetical protein
MGFCSWYRRPTNVEIADDFPDDTDVISSLLEKLNCPLVFLCSLERRKCSQVPALAGFSILLA